MRITSTALAVVLALAGCGGGGAAAVHHPPKPTPSPSSSYPDVGSLIAALAVHGAVCSAVTFKVGSTSDGSLNPFAECTGTTQADTVIVIFDNHADAVAYASSMISVSSQYNVGPTAEVVGPNWTVNTVPAFADKVLKAVGGELIT